MKKIAVLIILFILGFGSFVHAEEYKHALTFGLYTSHYSGDHCEGVDNRLIALENGHLILADFRNSYGNETQFVGYAYHTKKLYSKHEVWWTRGNVYAGVLIGYGHQHPIHVGVFSPGVYPTVSVGHDRYSLEMGVMPTFMWWGFKVEF